MSWAAIVTTTQIALSAASVIVYAFADDWPRALYWLAATTISAAIRLIK